MTTKPKQKPKAKQAKQAKPQPEIFVAVRVQWEGRKPYLVHCDTRRDARELMAMRRKYGASGKGTARIVEVEVLS